ncbi:MAG: GHMP kinase [Bacteroidetes bacterium]|nr:GHMP kinase [Bacteroidota bacterium]
MNFYSRGKLLISGEYLVIKGAKALMVPLLKGQSLIIKQAEGKGELNWISQEKGQEWFRAKFDSTLFEILHASDQEIAKQLQLILKTSRKMNREFISQKHSLEIVTDLEFLRKWGFGSSSTLISNIAWWAEINPYVLHSKVSKGSGYDVVAARMDNPSFFTKTGKTYSTENVVFNPSYRHNIYFIYLGKKQNSASMVSKFLESKKQYRVEKRTITELSQHMALAPTQSDFEFYIREHDLLMSAILKQPRLKDQKFADLKGEIKPLGAWGGDFAMITWNESTEDLKGYLKKKKIETYFAFDELIKTL